MRIILTSLLLFVVGIFQSSAQMGLDSMELQERPKIGLVLSGGVAHGLAHIGLIKYLEEIGIEIDYITGTSMGAIVGGLRATGMSGKEIENECTQLDWAEVIYNKIDLNKVAPTEKYIHNKMPIKVVVDKTGVRLPLGLIGGHNLDLLIARLYASASRINHFDDLPIPFRCIATDIVSAEKVLLDEGYLGRAIRASMSMPLVFSPVIRDQKMLVDGGLTRNYPVEEIRDMGAEIVIGCNVGYKLLPADELKSSVEILYQAGFMSMTKAADFQKTLTNIHLEPNVKDFSIMAFHDYEELIQIGYDEAKSHEQEFLKLRALLDKFEDNHVVAKYKLSLPDSLSITQITAIDGQPPYSELIQQRFDDEKYMSYSADQVDSKIHRIYGTKNFKSIDYSYKGLADETTGLNIHSQINKEVTAGINVNYFENTNTSLILSGEMRNVLQPLSRANVAARISDNPGLQVSYFQRIGRRKRTYYSFDTKFNRTEFPIYLKNDLLQQFNSSQTNVNLHIGNEAGDNWKYSFYYQFQKDYMTPKIILPNYIDSYQSHHHLVGFTLDINSLDDHFYPKEGGRFFLDFGYMADNNFMIEYDNDLAEGNLPYSESAQGYRTLAKLEWAHPLNHKNTLHSTIAMGYTDEERFKLNFRAGGTELTNTFDLSFIGKFEGQLTYRSFVYLRERWSTEIIENGFVSIIANAAYGQEALPFIKDKNVDYRLSYAAGIALAYKTPLGPLVINAGVSSDGFVNEFGMTYKYIY